MTPLIRFLAVVLASLLRHCKRLSLKLSIVAGILLTTVLFLFFNVVTPTSQRLSLLRLQQDVSDMQMENNDSSPPSLTPTLQVLLVNTTPSMSERYVVPNIVHFIWFFENVVDSFDLKFVNYVSIRSAYVIQKPDVIIFHYNRLPSGYWWKKLISEVPMKMVERQPPTVIHGQPIGHMFHRADVAKLEVLLEFGGIYLDYDVIVVNSLDPLRQYDATMGKEKYDKLIAGIMIARPNATFMQMLYESYRDDYRPHLWDYNCAVKAYNIYLKNKDIINVELYKLTTPDYWDQANLWDRVIDWSNLYVVHLMCHMRTDMRTLTPDHIRGLNTTFGQIMRYIYYGSAELLPEVPVVVTTEKTTSVQTTNRRSIEATVNRTNVYSLVSYKRDPSDKKL